MLSVLLFATTAVQAVGINRVGEPQWSHSTTNHPTGPCPAPPGMQPTVPRPHLPAGLQNYQDPTAVAASSIGDKLHKDPKRVGVIKRAVIDEARWDGSDLFVLPQNPNHTLYCSERFVEGWKAAKLKGALFSRCLMDPEAIKA